MIIFKTIADITFYVNRQKSNEKTIGLVPTMGALHEGHLELMRQAKQENDLLAVSIFVNPIQFNNPEDLKKYPRDMERDLGLLKKIGCDFVFAPSAEEMYPEEVHKTFDFGSLQLEMEGSFRPGHFNGVAIVVEKLLNIIQPDKAYFGEKDFQQLAIIQKLVELENIPVTVVPCQIIREKDGLAMSSRNKRLTTHEREIASLIYQTLIEAKRKVDTMSPGEIRQMVVNKFKDQPEFELEYFEIADDRTLLPVNNWSEAQGIVAFIAAYLGKVRLIDNIRLI